MSKKCSTRTSDLVIEAIKKKKKEAVEVINEFSEAIQKKKNKKLAS